MLRDGAVFASAAILLDRLFGLGDSLLAFFLAEATEFALAFVAQRADDHFSAR